MSNSSSLNRWTGNVFVSTATQTPQAIATFTQGRNTYVKFSPDPQIRISLASQNAKEFADSLNRRGVAPDAKDEEIRDLLYTGKLPTADEIAQDLVDYTRDGSISTTSGGKTHRNVTKRPREDLDR